MRINSSEIKNFLSTPESVKTIEDCISEIYPEYIQLSQNIYLSDNPGGKNHKRIPERTQLYERLYSIAEEARLEVYKFLGAETQERPSLEIRRKNLIETFTNWGYLGIYDPADKHITIFIGSYLLLNETRLLRTAIHEFSHFLQHMHWGDSVMTSESLNEFTEGHAVGVENILSLILAEKNGNQYLRYEALRDELRLLRPAYLYFSEKINHPTKYSLFYEPQDQFYLDKCYEDISTTYPLTPYQEGRAYFKVLEKTEGFSVYKRVLKDLEVNDIMVSLNLPQNNG